MQSGNQFSNSTIRQAIEKTGMPTEIKVTNILRNHNWTVFNERPYLDPDEKRVRTLDISAGIMKSQPKGKEIVITANIELFIECKRSKHQACVFHTENENDLSGFRSSKFSAFVFDRILFDVHQQQSENKKQIDNLNRIPIVYNRLKLPFRLALSHQVIGGGDDFMYEAYMQVIKALQCLHDEHTEEKKQNKMGLVDLTKIEDIFIPVVVFDGAMFACYFENGDLQIEKTQFARQIVNVLSNPETPAIIDIVSLEYFPEYLKNIEMEFPQPKKEIRLPRIPKKKPNF